MKHAILSLLTTILVRIGWWGDALSHLQCRCDHPEERMTADVLEGDFRRPDGTIRCVTWCRVCEAYGLAWERPDGSYRRGGLWEPRGDLIRQKGYDSVKERRTELALLHGFPPPREGRAL